MKCLRIQNIWSRKAAKDDVRHSCDCVKNDIVKNVRRTSVPHSKSRSFSSQTKRAASNIYSPYMCQGDEENQKKTKNISFQKTVYSDSIIVDAIPHQKKTPSDMGEHYVKENEEKNQAKDIQSNEFSSQERLSRDKVIHMLKNRFKDDLEDWQNRDQRPVDVRSEPSRSPKLSPRKRYGVLIKSPEAHPTLPRKADTKSGTIWLQCGDEVKQVELPRDGVSLGRIRQMFQNNFESELEKYAFGADRSILLIKDPFSRAFKELDDVRHVLSGSHLKLLGPKKKPCRDHHQPGRNVSFDERRRSRSLTSDTMSVANSLASELAGFSRARVGSYSFHGRTHSGYSGTLNRATVTSTPKPNHNNVRPSDMFTRDLPKATPNAADNVKRADFQVGQISSPQFPPRGSLNHADMSLSQLKYEPTSPTRKVRLPGLGTTLSETKSSSRNPVEEQLASLTNLLQEALRTDSVSDVNMNDCESWSDSPNVPPRPSHLPMYQRKKRSPSDSGTESLISEHLGYSPDEPRSKPPPPSRSSSREAMKSHAPKKEHDMNENSKESPRKSIARPRVWVDTSNRVRDNHIKVTSAYLKKDVKQLRIQLEELRNQHEYNAHMFNTLVAKTGQQIMAAIEGALPDENDSHVSLQRQKLKAEETAYQRRSDSTEKTMRRLESEIEMLRDGAVNYEMSVKPNELDEIHGSIENVSRSIASLKSDFGLLHADARTIMTEELHSLIDEERFFKEEPAHLDKLVNRCRHAAGTMFTLQKLASAQREMTSCDGKGSICSSVKSPMHSTSGIIKVGQSSKVQYQGTHVTVDYNQNTIPQGNGMKTKVRFNDSADHITYHQ